MSEIAISQDAIIIAKLAKAFGKLDGRDTPSEDDIALATERFYVYRRRGFEIRLFS
jgi:hypothetical protein